MSDDALPICEKKDTFELSDELYEVWYDSDFMNSEVTLLFLKTMIELMEKNWSPQSIAWCLDISRCKVFYCKNSTNQIVSGIVCFYIPSRRTGWILLSFTDPNYRKKGFNKILYKYVEKYFKSKGAKFISVIVNKDNSPRLIASQKNGLLIDYVHLTKRIENAI